MTPDALLTSITTQIEAFKAAATTSPADADEINDLRAQLDNIKHEGARAAIVRDIDRKTTLAKIAADRRADEEVRELYDAAELKRAFGIRVRSNRPAEMDEADAENVAVNSACLVTAPAADELVAA